ncbi:hypothetical protein [Rubinisphaera sp. JC750]|uniref:hypothetical protein n=1 Tax=Rubinisphaera sp. JC750 TaxID=2898658 RepID=UPI001F29F35E|nr:hypothetical protein [Rubinisphaera sp. JC750]
MDFDDVREPLAWTAGLAAARQLESHSADLNRVERLIRKQGEEQERLNKLPKCPSCLKPIEWEAKRCSACRDPLFWVVIKPHSRRKSSNAKTKYWLDGKMEVFQAIDNCEEFITFLRQLAESLQAAVAERAYILRTTLPELELLQRKHSQLLNERFPNGNEYSSKVLRLTDLKCTDDSVAKTTLSTLQSIGFGIAGIAIVATLFTTDFLSPGSRAVSTLITILLSLGVYSVALRLWNTLFTKAKTYSRNREISQLEYELDIPTHNAIAQKINEINKANEPVAFFKHVYNQSSPHFAFAYGSETANWFWKHIDAPVEDFFVPEDFPGDAQSIAALIRKAQSMNILPKKQTHSEQRKKYWVKHKNIIKGPFSRKKLVILMTRNEGKNHLLYSDSEKGPWAPFSSFND